MKEINLLGAAQQKKLDLEEIGRRVAPFSYGAAILTVILSAVTMGLFLYYGGKIKANTKKIDLVKTEIQKLAKNESLLITIDERTGMVGSILGKRASKSETLAQLKPILVPGFSLSSLAMNAAGESRITGSCSDNQCLTNLNERLEDLKMSGKFSLIVLPGIQRTANGQYSVEVVVR